MNIKDKSGQSPLELATKLFPSLVNKMSELSDSHAEQVKINDVFIQYTIQRIESALPEGLTVLKASLSKISKNQSKEAFERCVTERLENELIKLTAKTDKSPFDLFGTRSNVSIDKATKLISEILGAIKQEQSLVHNSSSGTHLDVK